MCLWESSANSQICRSGIKGKGPYLLPDLSIPTHTASLQNGPTHQATLHFMHRLSPLSPTQTTVTSKTVLQMKCQGSLCLQAWTFLYSSHKLIFLNQSPCLVCKRVPLREEYSEKRCKIHRRALQTVLLQPLIQANVHFSLLPLGWEGDTKCGAGQCHLRFRIAQ